MYLTSSRCKRLTFPTSESARKARTAREKKGFSRCATAEHVAFDAQRFFTNRHGDYSNLEHLNITRPHLQVKLRPDLNVQNSHWESGPQCFINPEARLADTPRLSRSPSPSKFPWKFVVTVTHENRN